MGNGSKETCPSYNIMWGFVFDMWGQRNGDGKASGKDDCTSLLGADKAIILDALPDKMMLWLKYGENSNRFTRLSTTGHWSKTPNIFSITQRIGSIVSCHWMVRGRATREAGLHHTCTLWLLTPLVFWAYKSVKIFTGQGMERNNDIARSEILRKSNKWDSTGDVLWQEQKQWEPRDHERKTCVYVKRKEIYWHEEIKESRETKAKSHSDL